MRTEAVEAEFGAAEAFYVGAGGRFFYPDGTRFVGALEVVVLAHAGDEGLIVGFDAGLVGVGGLLAGGAEAFVAFLAVQAIATLLRIKVASNCWAPYFIIVTVHHIFKLQFE